MAYDEIFEGKSVIFFNKTAFLGHELHHCPSIFSFR